MHTCEFIRRGIKHSALEPCVWKHTELSTLEQTGSKPYIAIYVAACAVAQFRFWIHWFLKHMAGNILGKKHSSFAKVLDLIDV